MAEPSVLFVCVHNAGRSQMAAALLDQHAGNTVRVRSAGTAPAAELNPVVCQAMLEIGIDLQRRRPAALTSEAAAEADVVITMGCGDTCPVSPGSRHLDWPVTDPAGKPLTEVRTIRDEIDHRVRALLDELAPESDS